MAFKELKSNPLRTSLSLLGVTVGIFSIISVFTMVDSLDKNVRSNIESLGNNVILIQKWPWKFEGEYNWWDYIARPNPDEKDLNAILQRSEIADAAAFTINFSRTASYKSNSREYTGVEAVTHQYNRIKSFELSEGRYFTENESFNGSPVVIIGSTIKQDLFPFSSAIGQKIKIGKSQAQVIGVFEVEGESMLGNSMDEKLLIPYNYSPKLVKMNKWGMGNTIYVQCKEDFNNKALADELITILRANRRLLPRQDNNFALNESSILSQGFDSVMQVLNLIGFIIGGFSILVGGFSIANIMFVSVRERQSMIGIQKSIGAKNSFVLFQFITESVVLCLIGGTVGLILIFLLTAIVSMALDMDIYLSLANILRGLFISALIGLISGFIPALIASRMDPVEAIRS